MTRMVRMTVMCVMAMLAVAAQSRAEVLITNLIGSYSGSTQLNGTGASYIAGNGKAAGFRMGDNSFLLDSVEFPLSYLDANDIPLVRIFDSSSNEPDNLLVTLNNPAFNYGVTDDTYAFTPAVPFELVANTDYWIVVNNDTTANAYFKWERPDGNLYPVGPMATATSYLYASYSTGPWSFSGNYSAYAVNGIIPEPATGALLALGLAGLAGRRSRQALYIISGCRKQALGGG